MSSAQQSAKSPLFSGPVYQDLFLYVEMMVRGVRKLVNEILNYLVRRLNLFGSNTIREN